ncbi:S8 family peptidase [Colwellia psychrerythraea]|uniref:Aqualysin 1, Xanthomonalisin n=1 Tax=Colwellia psychrerythraea TaxID=28229 RepID=A0A099KUA5_COLPS|nr:S8 family peptidase [Colwellia psychrerythraea]KGJ93775.1 Aqualysin 1, Xanthomonalisin [Colwellia psychrerythraea]
MNKLQIKLACLSAMALGVVSNAQATANKLSENVEQEVRYLVQLAPNSVMTRSLNARRDVISLQANNIVNVEGVDLKEVYPNSGMISVVANAEQLARLKNNSSVVNVVRADSKINIKIPEVNNTASRAVIPMAMSLENQDVGSWGIDRIDQRTNDYDGQYNPPYDGTGVIVYVMDSGVELEHPMLKDRVAYTKNTYNPDAEAFDCHGHGSHVIGTVGVENYGVATGATLVAIRPFNDSCGAGSHESFVGAIEFAVADSQAKGKRAVVNMSLGYGAESADAPLDFFETAIQAGIDAGVVMVTSTGNDSYDTCDQAIARMPNVISVAATREDDLEYMFTNDGPCVDIHAPGVNIVSMDWFSDGVRGMTGTSMASPHVAGAAALVLQANPDFTPVQVRDYLIEQSTKDAIKSFDSHGAPNRLLYVSDINGDGVIIEPPTCDEDPSQTQCIENCETDPSHSYCDNSQLSSGVAVVLSGSDKEEQVFTIDVPADSGSLTVTTDGDNGDADLYVQFGSIPTTSDFECRGYNGGSNESCTINNPQEGTYSVMVRAYNDFTDLSLTATFTGEVEPPVDCSAEPSHPDCQQPCEVDDSCNPAQDINETDLASADKIVRIIEVSAGQTLTVNTSGGAGDADLFINFNSEASSWWGADCSSRSSGNDETCVINNTEAGSYYITINAYEGSPFSGLTLSATAQ